VNTLKAAWLGSWKQPWDLGRGRRWGDAPWALAALSRAWILGGSKGRWPNCTWEPHRPMGPRPGSIQDYSNHPDPAWIALLRHGSPQVPAQNRGKRESELETWGWEALLGGDAMPLLCSGTALLDLKVRLPWIPLLGAVDEAGSLHLPPFLEPLIPSPLKELPPGWWACLLGSMDSEGRLLPENTPPDLPWNILRPWLEPMALETPPPSTLEPWTQQRGHFWVVDPRIRAWARGLGANPSAIAALTPERLALGKPPSPVIAQVLQNEVPMLDKDWTQALAADLKDELPLLPEPSGDPVQDRIRTRWGGDLPPPSQGYPEWGQSVHPCTDPFHWMAEGRRAFYAQDLLGALRAFTWAHAHFERLNSGFWADRAAANAELSAHFWGDLTAVTAWQKRRHPEPSPFREQKTAMLLAIQGEWEQALPQLENLARVHHLSSAWIILAQYAMSTGDLERLRETREHLEHTGMRALAEAYLNGMLTPPPDDLDGETRLIWELHLALKTGCDPKAYWTVWESCSNQPLRLGTALDLLEARSDERTVARLLKLQVLADRMGAPKLQARVRCLWPYPETKPQDSPRELLQMTLENLGHPAWLLWDGHEMGVGIHPPEGARARLRESGSLPPLEAEGWIWHGFPIHWQGMAVGFILLASRPEEPLPSHPELKLLGPWLERLQPTQTVDIPNNVDLITDGSEPMGSLLREMARVAPSNLSVLILGPTGSGKELTAREIHRLSGRSGPLIPVNVSSFAESLLETELFGHTKGAFTGADRDRKGAIEAAEGGTLFLDEIADLSLRIQSLLLRVLQEREVRRVGSDHSRRIDVRFLAATHKPLERLVATGQFRRDLLFRLQGTVLELPSLQARRHEFPFLVPRLVQQVALESKRPAPEIPTGLSQALARLPWPGNIRELRHALQRAILRCENGPLQIRHFPELELPQTQNHTWEEATREFQRGLLLDTLKAHHFQVTEAAACLGITRPALYLAAKRLGVDLVAERAQGFKVD